MCCIVLLIPNLFHFNQENIQIYLPTELFIPVHAIYSFDDIKRIVAYAFLRGIEIIPEIDVPGRMLLHTQLSLMISTNIKPLLLVDAASWGNAYPNAIVNCPDLVGKDDRLLSMA